MSANPVISGLWQEFFFPYWAIRNAIDSAAEERLQCVVNEETLLGSTQEEIQERLKEVALFTNGIYQQVNLLNNRYKEDVDLRDFNIDVNLSRSLEIAIILSDTRKHADNDYFPEKDGNSQAAVFIDGGESYVFFDRSENTLLRAASTTTAYIALKVDNVVGSIIPVVQYVPSRKEKKFRAGVLKSIQTLSVSGKRCLQYHAMLSDLQSVGSDVDEMVVVDYWPDIDLERFSKDVRLSREVCCLPFISVVKIGIKLAEGLHSLHKRNITHKNLSIKNCLANLNMNVCISNALPMNGKPPTPYECTTYGAVGYTCPHMLEEGYVEGGCGPKSDMYALGMILHMLHLGIPKWFKDTQDHCVSTHRVVRNLIKRRDSKLASGEKSKDEVQREFIHAIKESLKASNTRQHILNAQHAVMELRRELDEKSSLTYAEELTQLIYRLLGCYPLLRPSAKSCADQLRHLL